MLLLRGLVRMGGRSSPLSGATLRPHCTNPPTPRRTTRCRRSWIAAFRMASVFGLAYTLSKGIGFGENNDSGLFFNSPEVLARNRSLLGFGPDTQPAVEQRI